MPHVSISATGDETFDYYSFDATAGSTGTFDIDETFAAEAGGNIQLNATGEININNSMVDVSTASNHEGGDITIAGGLVNIIDSNLALNASTSGAGDGGDIIVRVENGAFNLINSSIITDSLLLTSGAGGDINITAAIVNIAEFAIVDASTSGVQDAGNIIVEVTDNGMFALTNSTISTSSFDRGNAGNIIITAGSIFLNEGAEITANPGINAGEVDTELFLYDIEGNLLAANDNADLSGSDLESEIVYTFDESGTFVIGVGAFDSFGDPRGITGNAIAPGENYTLIVSLENETANPLADGNLSKIEPNNTIDTAQNLNGSFSTTPTSTNVPSVSISAAGDGTFDYYSFDATAGSTGTFEIDETLSDTGAEGSIQLTATGEINIANNSTVNVSTASSAEGGDIAIAGASVNITDSNSALDVSTSGAGAGGDIIVEVREDGTFNLTNSTINGSTLGAGDGGDINITAPLANITELSRIDASTFGAGNGGSIVVDITEEGIFNLTNSTIITNSEAQGGAGNLEVNADFILLDNQGSFSAQTTAVGQGNINLTSRNILLQNNSFITTNAQNASGGNISINTDTLVGSAK